MPSPARSSGWRRTAAALLVCVAAAFAAPALAAPSKVVLALIAAAQKEFDAGNFARSAELFLDIWKADKSQAVVLYNAARAAHLAGQVDRAEELYRDYLALPAADAAFVAKIQPHLRDLADRRADAKAESAGKAETAGHFALAAQLWADAVAARPDKPAWRLRHARALHLAGDKAAALAGYDKYLALPADQAPGQPDAARWRAELAPRTFDEVPAAKDSAPLVVATPADAPSQLPGLALLAGGLALAAGGAGLYVATRGDVEAYNKLVATDASGKVGGTSLTEANAERDRLNGRIYASWGMAGGGAVAAGVGAWLLVRAPKGPVAVAPVGSGVVVAVRF